MWRRMMHGCLVLAFLYEASSFSAMPWAGNGGVVPRLMGYGRQPLYPTLSHVSAAGRQRQRRAQLGGEFRMSSDPGELLFSEKSDGGGYVQVWQKDVDDASVMRTLWFETSPDVWQTAVKFRRENNGDYQPDFSSLIFHSAAGLALASCLPPKTSRVLLVGLGGGALAGWMLANLPDLQQLVACEIDPVVRKAAEEHFLATWASDPRLTIVGDGLEYARNAGEEGFDLVLVDASEPVVEGDGGGDKGVFAPPRTMRNEDGLSALCNVLAPDGVMGINALAKDSTDLLSVVSAVEAAGLGVCYLENRDRSHSWMTTPDNKILLASRGEPMTEEVMSARAEEWALGVPGALELDCVGRIRKEFTSVKNLREREAQLRVFRGQHDDAVR